MSRTISTRIELDGEQEFKSAVKGINSELGVLKSEMAVCASEFQGQANSLEALTAKHDILSRQVETQTQKLDELKKMQSEANKVTEETARELEAAREQYGDGSEEVTRLAKRLENAEAAQDKYNTQVNLAQAELNRMTRELSETEKYMNEARASADGCATSIDEFGKKVKSSSDETTKFGEHLKTVFSGASEIVRGAASLTAEAGEKFISAVSDLAEYGDNIDKMSQKMGLSAEAYQEWDFIMQHCGTSIDSLQSGMKTLANAVESGNKAFERLGISQEQIAGMSNEELFSATISALQNVENETERTYLAGQLLGRGATELGALLNTSAEDTEAMRQQIHDLGGVMSDEAVKAAADYQDSLQNMRTAVSGLSRGMISEFMPAVTTIMDGITQVFSGNRESGTAKIIQGVTELLNGLRETAPKFAEVAGGLLRAFVGAIPEFLPLLSDVGLEITDEAANAILENLPLILETGLAVIQSLAEGMADNLPELIPVVVDAILEIVDTLTDPEQIDQLLRASLDIMLALARGLIDAVPKLLEKAPLIILNLATAIVKAGESLDDAAKELIVMLGEGLIGWLDKLLEKGGEIVSELKQRFIERASDMKDAGAQLLEGLWNGIRDKVEWLKGKVTGVVDTIKGWFTGSGGFDEHSPSRWAEQVGAYVSEGLGAGIDKEADGVRQSAEKLARDVYGELQAWAGRRVQFGIDAEAAELVNASMAELRAGAAAGPAGGGQVTRDELATLLAGQVEGLQTAAALPESMTVHAVLQMPDGNKFAEYYLPSFISTARANGTPIANPVPQ